MKMTNNLPMMQEVFQGSPELGHMQRPMTQDDGTDEGIAMRIQQAVEQGLISPEAGMYLIENIMGGQQEQMQAVRGMPRPQNMPPMNNIRGLLGE